jgi:PhzF family phenazine biosynthesis protein
MKIPLFQIDAFTRNVFAGNPAAICPLDEWLDPERMQAIAAENNLSETAFLVPNGDGYDLRWFTPKTEADLCGHATLASAFVLWNQLGSTNRTLRFNTRSGLLTVEKRDDLLVMNFPRLSPASCENPPSALFDGMGIQPDEVLSYMETEGSGNFLSVFASESAVRELEPDFPLLASLGGMGVIVTAPGDTADFASRYFAPGYGIDEDPVTGSIHCTLVPYWSERLGKQQFHAHQVSSRGGELFCELLGDRVSIAGHAVLFMAGTIEV